VLPEIFAKLLAVSGRSLFVCGALLVFANVAFGDGTYQRTKNGKTFVWNNDPKPGDEATWSGGRDGEGYAHGFGTLTWYTAKQESETGSTKPTLYARYWGNMVRGKLDGPVNAHSKGKTNHAIFADGVRTTRWAAGTAPSRAGAQQRLALARQSAVPEPASAKGSGAASPEAPAEGPPTTRTVAQEAPEPIGEPMADQPKIDVDNSLRLLVWPPRSLRMRAVSNGSLAGPKPQAASPAAKARLTKEEVVDFADAAARARGYDLAEYQRPEPQYDPADQIWSLMYDQKPVDGTGEIGKHFNVAVGDKTKRTALLAR
jgi:hypothetical protein